MSALVVCVIAIYDFDSKWVLFFVFCRCWDFFREKNLLLFDVHVFDKTINKKERGKAEVYRKAAKQINR